MKKTYIKTITGLGLISVLLLQVLWLHNTYIIIKKEIEEKSNIALHKAIDKEAISRFTSIKMPEGSEIMNGSLEDTGITTPGDPMFQEAFLKYSPKLSLFKIDSIYTTLLQEANIHAGAVLNRVLTKNEFTVESTRKYEETDRWGIIKTKIVPIRKDGSQGIQAILIKPHWSVFKQMNILLLATAIMMIFVVSCISYQIKIIIKQNKAAKLREDFSYAMIHDMKTPLNTILMGINRLQTEKLDNHPDKKDHYFKIVIAEANHLMKLTEKVLTISKLEQSKLNLDIQRISLSAMIEKLVETFKIKASKEVNFKTNFAINTVYADPEYLQEAISNLIDNAIKYSGKTVTIEISCLLKNEDIQIKVKDNGFGIPLKDQTKIFEKFERASAIDRNRKEGASGFGLGLNYVLRVIEAHNGRVDIESIEGEYSEFTINIPKRTEDL